MTDFSEQLQGALGQTYTIERELGGGGMSRVFVAWENALGRQVVIKLLSSDIGIDLSAERFAREIILAAGLQHPCIVPVLAAGVADGVPYYTMPFVAGQTLRERMAEHVRLPLDEVLSVLRDLASALSHAHARGIVHRDIKPENLLLSGGYAQVTDFGIARAISESRTQGPTHQPLTQTGTAIGTPAYMAPEQASGDGAMDQRADIYAFGCLAYELLSGAAPFAGRSPHMTLMAHVTETPVPLRSHRADLAPELALLVMRCLAKDPANRPQSADDLLASLRALPTSPQAVVPAASRVPRPAPAPTVQRAQRARVPRWAWYLTAGMTLVVVGLAAFAFRRSPASATPASVAVLPFTNVGGDSAQEYFSDGITDDLTSALADIPGLRVAPRRSAFAFKGKSVDARDIGKQLDVADVLEGSVRRTATGVRVNAELVRASDGTATWRKTFDRNASDLYAMQDEITRSIAGELHVKLRPRSDSSRAVHTPSLAAHDLYMRGEHLLNPASERDLRQAIDYFKQAVALDSNFARAWVGIAQGYSYLASSFAGAADAYPEGIAAARRAVALDSLSSDAHALLGLGALELGGDWAQAKVQLDEALRLEPTSADAYQDLSFYEAAMRRPRRAVANAQRALELDPTSAMNARLVEMWWLAARQPDSAMAHHRRTEALSPVALYNDSFLGEAYRQKGLLNEALSEYAQASKALGRTSTGYVITLHLLGRTTEARSLLEELKHGWPQRYLAPELIAGVHARLGDLDSAVKWLDKGVALRSGLLPADGVLFDLEPLRGFPPYEALLRRLRIPEQVDMR
ncbi:MAG: protein kinase [bacterium]